MNVSDVPPKREWVNIETETRIHPYEMYKITSMACVEVISKETEGNGTIKRYVVLRDGEYEVWVEASAKDTLVDERRPDERVSEAGREATEPDDQIQKLR